MASLPLPTAQAPEDVHLLLLPEFSALGLFSAIEPLRVANRFGGELYRWHLLSAGGAPVAASNGMVIQPEGALAQARGVSLLLVVAGFEPLVHYTSALARQLRELARSGAMLGSVDTGAFILAEAGLLHDEPLTLHWEAIAAFRERFPAQVVSPRLFELGTHHINSAGGTASIDMMLELIGRKHGQALALQVSEQFVLSRIREPSSHQRMEIVARYAVHNQKLVQVIGTMEQHMEDVLSVEQLAAAVGITRRHLERLFDSSLKEAPARFYMNLRLDKARELLLQTDMSVMAVCVACGFESASHFSRVYRQRFGLSPRQRVGMGRRA